MNPQHLSSEELAIESEIRGIKGSVLSQIKLVGARLIEETKDNSLVPGKPHKKAAARPRDEIITCCKILHAIRQEYDHISEETDNDEVIQGMTSRILHVKGRVRRVKGSKVVAKDAEKLISSCEEILKILANVGNLNESKQQMKVIEMSDHYSLGADLDADLGENLEADNKKQEPRIKKKLSNRNDGAVAGPLSIDAKKKHSENTKSDSSSTTTSGSSYNTSQSVAKMLSSTKKIPKIKRRDSKYEKARSESRLQKTMKKMGLSSSKSKAAKVNVESSSSSSESESNSSSSSSSDDHNEARERSNRNRGHRNQNSERRSFGLILKRDYNLKFDGATSKTPIERFLYRVREIAKDHGVQKNLLVGQLGSVLQDEAFDFYWTYRERNGNVTWSDLRRAFIYRFSDRRTQEDVWHSLEARKQRSNEPFLEYYNAILDISLSLKKPIKDSRLIRLLKDNMRPSLQSQLAGKTFASLPKLINKCITIEETWKRIKYRPEIVQSRRVSEIEGASSSYLQYYQEVEGDNTKKEVEAVQYSRLSNSKPLACWNCRKPGHTFQDCNVPKTSDFCYGCGQINTLKPNCNVCHPRSENRQQGADRRGSSSTPSPNPTENSQLNVTTEEAACNTDPELIRMGRRHRNPE